MKLLLKTTLLMSAILLSYTAAKAQLNLVPNPSFEEYDTCPSGPANFTVKNWESPTISTPDYFNSCGDLSVTAPNNAWGSQKPRTGNAYVGIATFDNGNNYREYLQCKLVTPLLAGRKYRVSYFVSLADTSSNTCNYFGFLLSKFSPKNDTFYTLYQNYTYASINLIEDITYWHEVTAHHVADGGEEYLTIGIFVSDEQIQCKELRQDGGEPYNYIDDVSVVEDLCSSYILPTAFTPNSDGQNDFFYPVFRYDNIKISQLLIYNGWGELIHNNPEVPWDGSYKGQPQPSGTYSYYIYADLPLPDIVGQYISCPQTGSVTLIR